ncbi:hypothetical protein K5D85_00105 [Deinococcus sp. RIT780]|nr:hypothetical protein [Deinococcus sp. RIT780]
MPALSAGHASGVPVADLFTLHVSTGLASLPGIVGEACIEALQEWFPETEPARFGRQDEVQNFFGLVGDPLEEVQKVLRLLHSSHRIGVTPLQHQVRWDRAVREVLQSLQMSGQLPLTSADAPEPFIHLPWLTLAELQLEAALTEDLPTDKSHMAAFRNLRHTQAWRNARRKVAAALRADSLSVQAARNNATPVLNSNLRKLLQKVPLTPDEQVVLSPATKLETLRGSALRHTPEDRRRFDPRNLGVPDLVLETYLRAVVPEYGELTPPITTSRQLREWAAPAKPELMTFWRVLNDLEAATHTGEHLLPYRAPYVAAVRRVTSALASVGAVPEEVRSNMDRHPPKLPWAQLAGWMLERSARTLTATLPWSPEALLKKVHRTSTWNEERQGLAVNLQRDAARTLGQGHLPLLVDAAARRLLGDAGIKVR